MEQILGIETKYGIIEGRRIFLDSIRFQKETEIILTGEISTELDYKFYKIIFSGINYIKLVELDFDDRVSMISFGIIDNSELIEQFKKKNHSSKLNFKHRHYYFRTYDTVFEIVADKYILEYE